MYNSILSSLLYYFDVIVLILLFTIISAIFSIVPTAALSSQHSHVHTTHPLAAAAALVHSLLVSQAEGLDVVRGPEVAHSDLLVPVGRDDELVIGRQGLKHKQERELQAERVAAGARRLLRLQNSRVADCSSHGHESDS